MHLANPYYFLLLFLIVVFILFYFFRKKYTKQIIPSNLLWEEVLKEMRASSWFHKWQNNVLFWLQLLCFVLLMLALVGPYFAKETTRGEQIILLFDTSASMAANGNDSTRLEDSKRAAVEMIQGIQQNQTVTVLEVNDHPKILLNNESDISKVRAVIKDLELSYTHEDWQSATELTASLAKEGKSAIHIFSDGVVKESMKNIDSFYVTVHNQEQVKEENISVLSFGVSKNDAKVAGIAMVENQTDSIKKMPFQVISEKTVLFQQEIELQPKERKIVAINDLPEKSYYNAKIDVTDDFLVDNIQTAVFNKQATTIYTDNDMNPFLIKGFEAIGLRVIQMEDKEDFLNKQDSIFLLSGSTLPDNIEGPFVFFFVDGKKEELQTAVDISEDELLLHVDMKDVFIASATKYTTESVKPIVKSGELPLIQKGTVHNQPAILVQFDLKDSDWPLHPSFPILLYNMYQWLSSQSNYIGDFQPLEARTLQLTNQTADWDIYDENDQLVGSFSMGEEGFQAPKLPGVYQLTNDAELLYFSVNLDDREKTIASQKSFILNEDQLKDNQLTKTQSEWLWYLLCVLAFVILCMEWEVYRRADRV
ncbi:BatA and WFA domain-containing protein [Niallia sp.]|uniref:BatA and WFA domain-containing protein n=1 Tax=Niallia sp. TaxID=2837523 RepID=UPI00289C7D2E|nr:BatA and WFA domain-containing protein [Niallia sp.]